MPFTKKQKWIFEEKRKKTIKVMYTPEFINKYDGSGWYLIHSYPTKTQNKLLQNAGFGDWWIDIYRVDSIKQYNTMFTRKNGQNFQAIAFTNIDKIYNDCNWLVDPEKYLKIYIPELQNELFINGYADIHNDFNYTYIYLIFENNVIYMINGGSS